MCICIYFSIYMYIFYCSTHLTLNKRKYQDLSQFLHFGVQKLNFCVSGHFRAPEQTLSPQPIWYPSLLLHNRLGGDSLPNTAGGTEPLDNFLLGWRAGLVAQGFTEPAHSNLTGLEGLALWPS